MASANLTDIQATLGRRITTQEETEQVNAWIADAELCISVRLGSLSELNPDVLRFVVKESVARRLRNPEGKTSERIDDYSYSLSTEAAKASLFITDEEWAMLTPGGGHGAGLPVLTPNWWVSGGFLQPRTEGMG